MPTNYNFTENNKVVSFDEAFIRVEQFRNTVYAWSSNGYGQLGLNDNATKQTPVREFTSSVNWKQVFTMSDFSGGSFSSAIKTDGSLWLWGKNTQGTLGVNDNISRSTPVREFTSSTNWKQVSCAQNNFTLAIKTDGTLWGWGRNSVGQLGVNDIITRSTPVQEFTSSTNWKQVVGGNRHTAAIKTNGELWSWGFGICVGLNDAVERSTPVREFTSSTNWKQVSACTNYTVAIKTDGTLWGWGDNTNGQLGVNDIVTRSTPVREFTSSTNWKQVSAGGYTTSAIKTDGTLWSWGGISGFTSIGDNTVASRSTPRQEFTSSINWKQVSAGGYGTLAIKAEDYPILY